MDIKLVYKQNSSTALLEEAILILLNRGICRIYSEKKEDVTIMSVLYIFSKERIANSLANLCNNEIILINYKTRIVSYTPIFQRLFSISKGWEFNNIGDEKTLVCSLEEKCKLLKNKETQINFAIPLKKIDLRLI